MAKPSHTCVMAETRTVKKTIQKKTEVNGKKKERDFTGLRKKTRKKKIAFSECQNHYTFKLPLTYLYERTMDNISRHHNVLSM